MDSTEQFTILHHVLLWICAFLCYGAYVFIKKRKYNLPPGPKGLPLVGILPYLSDKPYLDFIKWGEKYGGIFSVYLGRNYVVVVTDVDVGIQLLGKTATTDRPPDMFHSMPDGVGFPGLNGEEWAEQRRFTMMEMKNLGFGQSHWEKIVEMDISDILELLEQSRGEPVDIEEPLSLGISNSVLSLVTSRRIPRGDPRREIIENGIKSFQHLHVQTNLISFYPKLFKFAVRTGLLRVGDKLKDLFNMNKHISCLEEAVRSIIARALPSLPTEKINELTALIMKEGPEEVEDLRFLTVDDLSTVLSKLQSRKFLSFLKENVLNCTDEMFINGDSEKAVQNSTVQATSSACTIPGPSFIQSSVANQHIIHNWAENFDIPYHAFPLTMLKKCQEGLRLNPDEKLHVIRVIAYEVRKFCIKPGKKNLERIASKLVATYPLTFRDEIAGEAVGYGYETILKSLVSRVDNTNRVKGSSLKRKLPSLKMSKNINKRRCLVFQPDSFPGNETELTQEDKRKWLQEEFRKSHPDEKTCLEVMHHTFALQRLAINSFAPVKKIVEDWPFLTLKEYALQHFKLAMEPISGSIASLNTVMEYKIPEVLGFLSTKVKTEDIICKTSSLLRMLPAYFKENNDIIRIYKDCDTNAKVVLDSAEIPVTPFIADFGHNNFSVFIEKEPFASYLPHDTAFLLWFTSFYNFDLVYPPSCLATMEFIQTKEIEESKKNRGDHSFIGKYLDEMEKSKEQNKHTSFNDTTLLGNVQALIIAGSHTTRVSLQYLLLAMAAYPNIQTKVHEELDNVLGKDGSADWTERKRLPYCHAAILEGQRWRTVAPLNLLHMSNENIEINGYDIPKGTSILTVLWAFHHDPKYWKDPDTFEPARFLSGDGKTIDEPKAFIPFSYGKRICPGKLVALIQLFHYFVSIMQKFQVLPASETSPPDLDGTLGLSLIPKRQLLRFVPR